MSVSVDSTLQITSLNASPITANQISLVGGTNNVLSMNDLFGGNITNAVQLNTMAAANSATIGLTGTLVNSGGTTPIMIYLVIDSASILNSITIAPSTLSLTVGATQQLTASGFDQFGVAFPLAATTWSSDNMAVATVDATGLVTTLSAGTANITATDSGISATSIVTVTNPAPAPILTTLTISPLAQTIAAGTTQQMSATTLDQNNNPIAATVIWGSDNMAATIDANTGLITANSAGAANIIATATDGVTTLTMSTTVTVTPVAIPVLTSIALDFPTLSLTVGATQQLTASGFDQFGVAFPLAATTWSSDNMAVATVDATGLVTTLSAGTANITATDSGISATSIVTVTAPIANPSIVSLTFANRNAIVSAGNLAALNLSGVSDADLASAGTINVNADSTLQINSPSVYAPITLVQGNNILSTQMLFGYSITYAELRATAMTSNGLISVLGTLSDEDGNITNIAINISIDVVAPVTPAFSPAASDYMTHQLVIISSSDSDSGLDKIYFTIDGTAPDNSKTQYVNPINVDKDMTIKAIAYDKAGNASNIATATYGIAPVISNENNSEISTSSTTITWLTDTLSTSRVVYDTVSHAAGAAPNYGYANSTSETNVLPMTITHSVILDGLLPGTTYYYRTISHGSPVAVSSEKSFVTATVVASSNGGGHHHHHHGHSNHHKKDNDIAASSFPSVLTSQPSSNQSVAPSDMQNSTSNITDSAIPGVSGAEASQNGQPATTQDSQSSSTWPWVAGAIVLVGAITAFIRKRNSGLQLE